MIRMFVAVLAASVAVVGLAGCVTMTPKQEAAAEQRRFCERNPMEVARCNGFLGDL